ncbi:hypothetical protein [Kitasatospora sp. NPDC093558]|uniref:hypothetical protein n=1 Tax=Kitasatospora sp. NPDC093558 TaxID=3155201 RepID=UPI00343C67B0
MYVLHAGAKPASGEIEQIVDRLERDTGFDLGGTRLSVLGGVQEPSVELAQAIVARREHEGDVPPGSLERMITKSYLVDGARRVVILIPKAERNP